MQFYLIMCNDSARFESERYFCERVINVTKTVGILSQNKLKIR